MERGKGSARGNRKGRGRGRGRITRKNNPKTTPTQSVTIKNRKGGKKRKETSAKDTGENIFNSVATRNAGRQLSPDIKKEAINSSIQDDYTTRVSRNRKIVSTIQQAISQNVQKKAQLSPEKKKVFAKINKSPIKNSPIKKTETKNTPTKISPLKRSPARKSSIKSSSDNTEEEQTSTQTMKEKMPTKSSPSKKLEIALVKDKEQALESKLTYVNKKSPAKKNTSDMDRKIHEDKASPNMEEQVATAEIDTIAPNRMVLRGGKGAMRTAPMSPKENKKASVSVEKRKLNEISTNEAENKKETPLLPKQDQETLHQLLKIQKAEPIITTLSSIQEIPTEDADPQLKEATSIETKSDNIINDVQNKKQKKELRIEKPSSQTDWGPSFGTAPSPLSNQVSVSPLNSWYLSQGHVDFKKKMQMSESITNKIPSEKISSKTESKADEKQREFLSDLAGVNWRTWYSHADPKNILDPPLKHLESNEIKHEIPTNASDLFKVGQFNEHKDEEENVNMSSIDKLRRALEQEKKKSQAFGSALCDALRGKLPSTYKDEQK